MKHKPLPNHFRAVSDKTNSIIDIREGLAKLLGDNLSEILFLDLLERTRDPLRVHLLYGITRKLGNGTQY